MSSWRDAVQANNTWYRLSDFTPENVYFQSDRVQQVFSVKLSLEQRERLAKPGMPADGEIPLH